MEEQKECQQYRNSVPMKLVTENSITDDQVVTKNAKGSYLAPFEIATLNQYSRMKVISENDTAFAISER